MKRFSNLILTWVFPFAYALIVTAPTVQLGSKFLSAPPESLLLFGFFSFAKVWEFTLPLFVFSFETISIRTAVSLWISGFAGQVMRTRILAFVLMLLQLFPVFATYYDARSRDFANTPQGPSVGAIERIKEENASRIRMYEQQLATYEIDFARYESRQKALSTQIDGDRTQVRGLSQRNVELNAADGAIKKPATYERLQAAIAEEKENKQRIILLEQSIATSLKAFSDQSANVPTRPSAPVLLSLSDIKSASTETELDFVVRTALTTKSLISLFVALIFPCVVLGAAYGIAQNEQSASKLAEPASNLESIKSNILSLLPSAAKMPATQQVAFVADLLGSLPAALAAYRATTTQRAQKRSAESAMSDDAEVARFVGGLRDGFAKSGLVTGAVEASLRIIERMVPRYAHVTAAPASGSDDKVMAGGGS